MSTILNGLYESLMMSIRTLLSHKLRTSLTMLGISIGIFAITFVFTLSNTLEHALVKNLESLGNTVLYVHNWPWRDNSEDWFKYVNRPRVSQEDFQRLRNNLKDVVGVYMEASSSGQTVRAGGKFVEGIGVSGVTSDYPVVNSTYEIEYGRFFSNAEIEASRPVCIIGVKIAEGLFEDGPYVGREVIVRGKRLRVIGVWKRQGASLFGTSGDEEVTMSYKMFTQIYNTNSRRVDKVIGIRAAEYGKLDDVEGQTIGLVRLARGLRPAQEDNFSINRQETVLGGIKNVLSVIPIAGLFISFFALLVGGFGIANIMFVSVKERTSEIGVQKALGATKPFILSQFLIEAVILCLFGGLIGILLVVGISAVAQSIMNNMKLGVDVVLSAQSVFIGVFTSVVIGIVFGFLPANTAANLDPVEAMRQA